ncbi:P-loop containing nucleoside triphosphate hydrolase protein [Lentinula edodes]|uniref:P-loop containing nucleoside triphosphate hydrolase protein n=1 Tax=Lentinula edodes TaxID=5353 RepID=UPI001E8D99BF|nr:P-loop containing nucleoside triphosphate hydrolase protein [Lentinula edodes]KAH7881383.1 P-loop containing nucleoside triphosphate hydrolase protein [Lentinula edodes]
MSASVFLLSSFREVTGLGALKTSTRSVHTFKTGKNNASNPSKRKRTQNRQNSRGWTSPSPPSSEQSPAQSFRSSTTKTPESHRPRLSRELPRLREKDVVQQRIASFQTERNQDANQWAQKLAERHEKEAREERHRKMVQEMKRGMQVDAVERRRKELESRIAKRDGTWKHEIHNQKAESEQTLGRSKRLSTDSGKFADGGVGSKIQSWITRAPKTERTVPVRETIIPQTAKDTKDLHRERSTHTSSPHIPLKPKIATNSSGLPQLKEFYRPPPSLTQRKGKLSTVPLTSSSTQESTSFSSPPLLPGLVSCLNDILGPQASPTEIQRLSIARVVDAVNSPDSSTLPSLALEPVSEPSAYKEFLLASETGSGKSIAYLLPLLQSLKVSELAQNAQKTSSTYGPASKYAYNPRSLVLAPTHELARQLSGFAKTLSHEIKLRVVCTSRANGNNREKDKDRAPDKESMVLREMRVTETEGEQIADGVTELDVRPLSRDSSAHILTGSVGSSTSGSTRPVDVMVGTPMKFLEMIFGRGWDRADATDANNGHANTRRSIGKPEMGLSNIEWVIIDEADVLFDPDFNSFTRLILAEISKARGKEVTFVKEDKVLSAECYPEAPAVAEDVAEEPKEGNDRSDSASESLQSPSSTSVTSAASVIPTKYPFNLILTTATIPPALLLYLQQHHPAIFARRPRRSLRPNAGILRSSGLHRLPTSLKIDQVDWSGGNKLADIEKRLRAVWMEDERRWMGNVGKGPTELSKIIVFCNKSAKVDDLGAYLEEKGIKTVTLTSRIGSLSTVVEAGEDHPNPGVPVEEGKSDKAERKGSERRRGSNKHLEGFLRVRSKSRDSSDSNPTTEGQSSTSSAPRRLQPLVISSSASPSSRTSKPPSTPATPTLSNTPHVLLTTSLLSRGLDFAPSVRHVFIVDEPRNVVDFLHRAGRTGRAGTEGVVVVFGKGGRSTSQGKKGLPMEWRGGRS